MKYALIGFNCRYTHSCLSLFYVRNELAKNIPTVEITLHQFTINDPYFSTLTHISSLKAEKYFFSVYIWNVGYISRIINDLSKIFPNTCFILGGPQAEALSSCDIPPKTTILSGEIEAVSPSFYVDITNGSLMTHYQADKAADFPSPYKTDDFSENLKNRHIYYESSRGCPYTCSYCLSASQPGVRTKNIEQVKKELSAILKHNPGTLRFVDRTFNACGKRAIEIWTFLNEFQETSFHFEISPDIFNEEMFSFLESLPPGRFQFEIGIQSTHTQTLSAIRRKSNITMAMDNIKRLIGLNNLHLHIDLILGLPYDTVETFARSFEDVFLMQPHYIQMGLLKILPGTPIREQVAKFSIQHCQSPPYETLATKWMNHEEISDLYWLGECVESFYNNRFFKSFFRWVAANYQNCFDFFSNLLNLCRQEGFFAKARTQQLMSLLLIKTVINHPQKHILHEILVYDWLRSGHRFLPDHLIDEQKQLKETKDHLWKTMPQDFSPYYTYMTRNNFFKQSLFVEFSSETLEELGFSMSGNNTGIICFLPEKEASVMELTKTTLLPFPRT